MTDLFTFLQTIDRFRVRCVQRRFALLETCWTNVEVDCCKRRIRQRWQMRGFLAKLPTALSINMKFESARRYRYEGGRVKFVNIASVLELLQADVTLTVQQLTKDEAHINRSPASPASPAGGLWQLLHASIFAWRLPPISVEESKRFTEFLQGETFSAPLAAIFPRALVVVEPPEKLGIGKPSFFNSVNYGTICVRDPHLNLEWRLSAWDWHNNVWDQVCRKEEEEQRRIEKEQRRIESEQRRQRQQLRSVEEEQRRMEELQRRIEELQRREEELRRRGIEELQQRQRQQLRRAMTAAGLDGLDEQLRPLVEATILAAVASATIGNPNE